ncbi:MAG TPA: hypothetical protein VJZ32_10130 [Candidatus Bathyarchaeia archaeon]|nr:hypothetical protein [Candidatus Bathyarchaeia archaeon]
MPSPISNLSRTRKTRVTKTAANSTINFSWWWYKKSQNWTEIDDTQLQILYVARNSFPEGTSTAMIAKETGIDYRSVMEECEYLADRNFMEIIEWGLHVHLIKITDEGNEVLKEILLNIPSVVRKVLIETA